MDRTGKDSGNGTKKTSSLGEDLRIALAVAWAELERRGYRPEKVAKLSLNYTKAGEPPRQVSLYPKSSATSSG